MAVAAPSQVGGRTIGAPERAFLLLGFAVAIAVGAITYSVESSNPSVVSVYERLKQATYEDVLPSTFEFKRFVESQRALGWTSDDERGGVAKFSFPGRSHIAYSFFGSPHEASASFSEHRASHVLHQSDPLPKGFIRDRYLGPAGVTTLSFCVDLGFATECVGVDGNAVITGLATPTRAEARADIDSTFSRAKLLLEAGLATLEEAR